MNDPELTQMPDPYLDGITREVLVRELVGNVYIARMRLGHAVDGGNKQAIDHARTNLAMAYQCARAEHVAPFYKARKGSLPEAEVQKGEWER